MYMMVSRLALRRYRAIYFLFKQNFSPGVRIYLYGHLERAVSPRTLTDFSNSSAHMHRTLTRAHTGPSRASPRTYVSSYGRPYCVRKQYSAMCRSTGLEAWQYRKATHTSSGHGMQ